MRNRHELLQRMATAAERLLDHQIRAAEDLDDKAEQMIRLAIATMAGAITIAVVVGQEPAIDADPISAFSFAPFTTARPEIAPPPPL